MWNLFTVIEGNDAFLAANLAQGLDPFIEYSLTIGATRTLVDRVRREPQDARRVLQRLLAIVAYRTDGRYANPNDVAISIYGIILSAADTDTFAIAATAIGNAVNCWWAPRVLERIDPRRNSGGVAKPQPVNAGAVNVQSTQSNFDVWLQASPGLAATVYTAQVSLAGSTGGVFENNLVAVKTPTDDSVLANAA